MKKVLLIFVHCILISAKNLINKNDVIPPDSMLPFEDYCKYHDYPVQQYNVTTSDGFILTIFRVQGKNSTIVPGKQPVIIQHGLLQSSDAMIVNSEQDAPAFILADNNFDVWVTNVRGTKYGKNHANLTKDPSELWDFTFQDMAQYDLPAFFEFIHNVTGQQKIDYIGHSQGTLIMFIALSQQLRSVYTYLNKFIALAPVVFVNNTKSTFLKTLSDIPYIGPILASLGINEIFPYNKNISEKLATSCYSYKDACKKLIDTIISGNSSFINFDQIGEIAGHSPGGTSMKNLLHFQQYVKTGEFKMYDYGSPLKNNRHYGQPTPPLYHLDYIKYVPIYLFAGNYDSLADQTDVEKLYTILKNQQVRVQLQMLEQGHSSFIFGTNMTYFKTQVIDILKQNNTNINE